MSTDNLIKSLLEPFPEVRDPVKSRIGKIAKVRMKKLHKINSLEIPNKLFICPFSYALTSAAGLAEESICNFHYNTGEEPTKLDCYICRQG